MHDVARKDRRLMALIGCIEGAVLEYDGDARCLDVWTIAPRLLAAAPESMIGKTVVELVGEAGIEDDAAIRRVHRTGEAEHTETSIVLDGKKRWFINDIKRVEGEDGCTVVVFSRDITERKEAEEALRISDERFRLLQNASNDMLWDWDFVTNEIWWGEAAERLFFTKNRNPSLEWWLASIHPDDRSRARDTFFGAIEGTADSWSGQYRFRRGDGIYLDVLARASILRKDGKAVRAIGSMVDITETKRLQAQLVQADRLVALGTLAAGVGHEINSPLSYVLGNLDLALEPGAVDPVELPAVLDEAREGARRIAEVVRSLKLFSRHDPTVTQDVSLESVLDRSLKMAENDIRHRARVVRCFGKAPGVNVSESQLGQVCLNLIINAAQAITPGTAEDNEIRVTTGVDARGRAFFSVSDTGGGIPPELLGRIFDPFFTTKPVGVGTGIGLSVCMNLVQSMDGELTVESAPSERTTFTVALPVRIAGAA